MMSTLIILHGWAQDSSSWLPFQKMVTTDYPTLVINLPGFGTEPVISNEWGIPEYAGWVTKKLETIPGNKVILGHSFGGRIASYIASQNPPWLKALVLYGAPCIYRPTFKIKLKIRLAKILKPLKHLHLPSLINTELKEADNNNMGTIFRNTVGFDQTDALKKISVPTLLVWGEYDTAAPLRIAREIHALIPESNLIIMDKVGHNAHQENLYLFYGILKNFIKNF